MLMSKEEIEGLRESYGFTDDEDYTPLLALCDFTTEEEEEEGFQPVHEASSQWHQRAVQASSQWRRAQASSQWRGVGISSQLH